MYRCIKHERNARKVGYIGTGDAAGEAFSIAGAKNVW
jgi:hypothetical protein